jgi:hypothetical protein
VGPLRHVGRGGDRLVGYPRLCRDDAEDALLAGEPVRGHVHGEGDRLGRRRSPVHRGGDAEDSLLAGGPVLGHLHRERDDLALDRVE